MKPEHKILIVDDDVSLAEALKGLFENEGYQVSCAPNTAETLKIVEQEPVSLSLVDLRLGQEDGLDILTRMKELCPEMSVIVITASPTAETSVEAMRRGADNVITKPLEPSQLLAVIDKGLEIFELRQKIIRLEGLK